MDGMDSETMPRRAVRGARSLCAALGALALVLALGACDLLGDSRSPEESETTAAASPMDPAEVAESAGTAADPAWLCDPGGGHDAPSVPDDDDSDPGTARVGALTPQSVTAEGSEATISGPFSLPDGTEYTGFAPEAVIVPADPLQRGAPAAGWAEVLAGRPAADSPAPPIVVRERVEVPADGPAPSAATAHLTLGTCDDSPLPDGAYVLRLLAADGTWAADGDVLLDVVGGTARAVPGAVTAPDGEVPVDLSGLTCRAAPATVGDGDGLTLAVADPVTTLPAQPGEDGTARGVSAAVTVTAAEPGSRTLLQGIVLLEPSTGTIVAGARNADRLPLQWIGPEGVTRTETAWTTTETCTRGTLEVGELHARAFAVTVDADGATHVLLSDPWTVTITEGDGS
ncbi:hypothetical protein [Brachybacterium sp. J153]|uniref:hypothetical protein n=1 Tax=Brachybacterium sp. J153 TaxID=3116488 RepID=UPI002E7A24BD|nr:hypothetical protein [Brachybacterium sp. J153]MEE1618350.1 hypothetical protein [Brachybacterium sp. J153]